MNLDQGVEVEAARQPKELAQRGVVEDRADQQHGVRAEGAGLVDLVGVDDEVLAQQRQIDDAPDGFEVGEATLEKRRVGEHRQRPCAPVRIGARDRHRIEVGADHAARGRRLFNLGDDRATRTRQRRREATARSTIQIRVGERLERTLTFVLGDLLTLGLDDLVEDHADTPARLSQATRSRISRARPLSIAERAAVIPIPRVGARSAT